MDQGDQELLSLLATDLDGHFRLLVEAYQQRLYLFVLRLVGRPDEAEDIVQETWIRWQNCDRSTVRDPRAFLAATTARLSSNAAQSARARHESYIHTWLPEPADATADPALAAERGDAIEFAVRLTLEKLSPSQRASYVLRHAFDYPYVRIAEIIQQTQASVRQHVSRARKRLAGRDRVAISVRKHRQPCSEPASQIGNNDVPAEMELRFVENPPAAGPSATLVKRPAQFRAKHGSRNRVRN